MTLLVTKVLTPCVMGSCSTETKNRWKERWRFTKKYGIRAGFAGVSSAGLVIIAKEACTNGVKRHAKRYIGGILVDAGLASISAGSPLLTNANKVVKYFKATHSVCAASSSWRVAHNVAGMPLILLDYAIFGEYIPSCREADYDIYLNVTDVASDFING